MTRSYYFAMILLSTMTFGLDGWALEAYSRGTHWAWWVFGLQAIFWAIGMLVQVSWPSLRQLIRMSAEHTHMPQNAIMALVFQLLFVALLSVYGHTALAVSVILGIPAYSYLYLVPSLKTP